MTHPESARTEVCGSPRPNQPSTSKGKGDSIPISIADGEACPRYSAIVIEGVGAQPAPLWMQLRLGHVGQRPISGLVDLTNYIMMDLGQPMHAFDGDKVRQVEVDWAADGERFQTLDGVERVLTKSDLMIKSKGKSVALAGVMGGLETEVTATTKSLLLESANFDGATVRRTATRLGLRTDASARFEKQIDPANTVLGIERFVQLACDMYPQLRTAARLSDCYPGEAKQIHVSVNPRHVARTIGHEISLAKASDLLVPLGFEVTEGGGAWQVAVPSHRATGDISIEADVVEELARRIGYDKVVPAMPHTTARTFALHAVHELEQQSLRYFTTAHGFHEIQQYLWYDDAWLAQIGFEAEPGPELRNPAGAGLHRLRGTLVPGMLSAAARNRFHFDSLALVELGSIFHGTKGQEFRHVGLVLAERGKNVEANLSQRLRTAIVGWGWERFGHGAIFGETIALKDRPWERERTAGIVVGDIMAGRIGFVDLATRRRMDDHLAAWGLVWAELHLSALAELPRQIEKLGTIPPFPPVEVDFTLAVPKATRFAQVQAHLMRFAHPLLKSIRFVTSFEGAEKAEPKRSLTFRCVLADPNRTLTDADTAAFRSNFEKLVAEGGYELKKT